MTRKILAAAVCGRGGDESEMVELCITDERLHASGVFSNVYQAHLVHPEERQVAIKKIWPKDGERNNDLHFLQQLSHPHIVRLLYHFNVTFDKHRRCECLVFEFLPTDLAKAQKESRSRTMDLLDVKLYTWQMFCALGYLNSLGVAHRDVKPSNLLCDPETGVLKLGDFGSAKRLVRGEKSTSYQVTRYYRAPELLFESVHYTPDIDIWAGACVLGELLIGNVMLPGRSKDDQTRIVIELFGYPSDEDCAAMHVARPRFARRPARGIGNLFPNRTPVEALELLESMLQYAPQRRLRVAAILNHRFYDDLRTRPLRIRTNGRPLPTQQLTTEEPTPPNAAEAPPDDAHPVMAVRF